MLSACSRPSQTDFTGFWKGECTDAFGVQIKHVDEKNYSVSFCGPGGCFEPGEWAPNTPIIGDPGYRVENGSTLFLKGEDRWQKYTKCTTDTHPVLDYATMVPPQEPASVMEEDPGIPDYAKHSPFIAAEVQVQKRLAEQLAAATPAPKQCEVGRVALKGFDPELLMSNLCKREEFDTLRGIVASLAPTLDKQRLTLWKVLLDPSLGDGLLVGYVDVDKWHYPHLSLWYLGPDKDGIRSSFGGSYLAATLYGVRPFGAGGGQRKVMIKHLSCIECEPVTYVSILDLTQPAGQQSYRFSYDTTHKEFGDTIEYQLPGMGHTVDADVETRIPAVRAGGPHLLQYFKYTEEVKHEWWVFTCKERTCDYEMFEKDLPKKYQGVWNLAQKI